jgi:LysR family transcriptional activator of nhaA
VERLNAFQTALSIQLRAPEGMSGSISVLFEALEKLSTDDFLTTELPRQELEAHAIAMQEVGLHGHKDRMRYGSFEDLLAPEPLILATDPAFRPRLESSLARPGLEPNIIVKVDDTAMVRLLDRENVGVAVALAAVLADEIANGRFEIAAFAPDIVKPSYAVTFPNPTLAGLISPESG